MSVFFWLHTMCADKSPSFPDVCSQISNTLNFIKFLLTLRICLEVCACICSFPPLKRQSRPKRVVFPHHSLITSCPVAQRQQQTASTCRFHTFLCTHPLLSFYHNVSLYLFTSLSLIRPIHTSLLPSVRVPLLGLV